MKAQTTITLSFSGIQNGLSQPLDSTKIENLTQGGDTMLHAPDTALELTYISGIHNLDVQNNAEIWLYPAYYLTSTGVIQVWLFLEKQSRVTLRLFDIAGIEYTALTEMLQVGQHRIYVHTGIKTFLILSAESNGRRSVCKITGFGTDDKEMRLEYGGLIGNYSTAKIQLSTFPWFPGDHLRFTGFAGNYSDTIIDDPIQSKVYVFVIPGSQCPPTVTDTNGNVYNTVQISYQCWLRENLRVRHYNNGLAIPNNITDYVWSSLTTGAMSWYNNDSATYFSTYGALYNWHAVNSGQLCPTGWHVPSDAEFKTLEISLGMTQAQVDSFGWRGTDEGGKLKETGTAHWNAPNTGATNSGGLTLLPGGCRFGSGGYYNHIGNYGYLWSATSYDTSGSWFREFSKSEQRINRVYPIKTFGFSVRCIKDT